MIVLYAILVVLARPISYLFTKDENVSNIVVSYLRIVPLGYAFMGVLQMIIGAFNALRKPSKAAAANLTQMLVIYVPLAIVTLKHFGINAIFISLVASYVIVSIAAHFIFRRDLNKLAISLNE